MIYIYVIASALVIVSILLSVRSRIRRHNVRRIVRRMGKRGMQPTDGDDPPVLQGARSPRAAAIELHHARKLLRDADREWKKGNSDAAERHLIGAMTSAPREWEAQTQLGILYLQTGRGQKAQAVFEPLAERHADPVLWSHLAHAYELQEKEEEACMAYRKALDLDPQNPHAQADLGRSLLTCGACGEAAILLEDALKKLPRRIDLLALLAECYEKDKKTDAAMSAYRRINRLDPRDEKVKKKMMATPG